ncbi:hypothetical protein AB0J72_19260 [Dactylosporangium sp. NPDC049742]|uniref:hypothetical protein n=1 Tax=Dactylosporangium sp. NPDC049742 TaxID=3154737 RepID=UPI00342FD74A
MAAESSTPHDPEQPQQVEALIDELILEILDSADQGHITKTPGRGRGRGPMPGGLLESVRAGMARGGMARGGSTLERLLMAEALAGVLADALAPALAEALAPRIMKVLQGEEEDEPAGDARTPAKTPSRSHTRKSESK